MRTSNASPHGPDWFREKIAEASLEVARTALAMPGMYPQGQRLHSAKRALAQAQLELEVAQKDWDLLVAPAMTGATATPRRRTPR